MAKLPLIETARLAADIIWNAPCVMFERDQIVADLRTGALQAEFVMRALSEASRALTDLDPLANHHDAKLIDEAIGGAACDTE